MNEVTYLNCKIGDKVCFKNNEEKEKYERINLLNLTGCVYGIVINTADKDRLTVDWINHKGIKIMQIQVYYKRLKFYDAK